MFYFNAKYLMVADLFAARGDVRFYLNGYNVVPHPKQGVLIRASNGHIACIIHDPNGEADGDHIIARNPDLLRGCRLSRDDIKLRWQRFVQWGGVGTRITVYGDKDRPGKDSTERFVTPLSAGALVDGRFPDIDRVIPEALKRGMYGAINTRYFALFEKAADILVGRRAKHGHEITCSSAVPKNDDLESWEASSMVFNIAGAPEFMGIVMPVRVPRDMWGPDTGRFRSTAPKQEDAA